MQRTPDETGSAEEERAAICASIRGNATFTLPFVVMNALATVVACYGLFQNSAAVVIGAMIIAVLLGPISGIALSLVQGDSRLLRQALIAETGGVMVVLAVAFAIGKIHQDLPLTAEIIARTSPNILDLMVALAGGAAGAYATVSPRLSVGLVGVAIATALVPPLATCAICLARGENRLAFGGFLLFLANIVAIQFASSVVMFLHGYHRTGDRPVDGRGLAGRNAVSLGLVLMLGSVLGFDFSQSIDKQSYRARVRHALESALKVYPGVQLADLRIQPDGTGDTIVAVVRTPFSFTPERVAEIETKLPPEKGEHPQLHIRSVITKETTRNGYLHEMKQTPPVSDADKIGQ